MNQKIAVIGATGATGTELVTAALRRGHHVIAIARNPNQLATRDPRLEVCWGDVLDPGTLKDAIAGAHVVLSALGSRAGRPPTTLYSAGTANLLEAMKATGARRLICISATPVAPASEASLPQRLIARPILYRFFGGDYHDWRRMEQLLADSNGDCDWSVLRPPRLTNKPATGRYRTAIDTPLPRALRITRADLAAAMLDLIDDPAASRATITIAN